MKTALTTTILLTFLLMLILPILQPAAAYSSAQISNVQFNYQKYLNGVYIPQGTPVVVSATIYNGGSQVTTFSVCASQRVGYSGGSYGDTENFGCTSITLGTICSSTTGVVTIPTTPYASTSGELLMRLSVYGPSGTLLTTSQWYPVTYIVP
jgi:hypothetical protein